MIMINGNWEQVKDLSDILRIVSENIGNEFSQKVEEICGEPSEELFTAYQKLESEDVMIMMIYQKVWII